MMLNEIENISTPIQEAYRVIKHGGMFVFSVTHPAWDLFVYAQQLAGKPIEKIKGLGGYFRRGNASYGMGLDGEKYLYAVEHYQRPICDYFSTLKTAGFVVTDFVEPELTAQAIAERPDFKDCTEHPMGLIFKAVKSEK